MVSTEIPEEVSWTHSSDQIMKKSEKNVICLLFSRALENDRDECCINYYNDGISCKGMRKNLVNIF